VYCVGLVTSLLLTEDVGLWRDEWSEQRHDFCKISIFGGVNIGKLIKLAKHHKCVSLGTSYNNEQ
jgi:hypothetical protein